MENGDRDGIDRHSWQHVVDFLDNVDGSHEVFITEMVLHYCRLVSNPSDGGWEVLRTFFARSDTILTKVTLDYCDFGTLENDFLELLAAFQTNRTVSDLTINGTHNLRGAVLGACFSGLMQNMPQLQRLECSGLGVEGVRAFQPALQANRTLKELDLSQCEIGDEAIRLLANALTGNTTMEVLNISFNYIASDGLDDITRIIESTQVKTLKFSGIVIVVDCTAHNNSTAVMKVVASTISAAAAAAAATTMLLRNLHHHPPLLADKSVNVCSCSPRTKN
jgi:hypothetical protein